MADPTPVLSGLNLVARDMNATLAFYRALGVEIPEQIVWGTQSGAHHVVVPMPGDVGLDLDSEAMAAAYSTAWRGDEPPTERTVIGFSLPTREAVDASYASMLEAGHRGLQPPYDTFWGARYAILEDPDGRHVGLMSPLDPARRSAPPEL